MKIRKIIKEELDKLDEDITSGQSIVWNRTKPEFLASIKDNGYIIGTNNLLGKGIYACFDFNSQLIGHNQYRYGSAIVECKVRSLDGFLCLLPQESKKIFGNKWRFRDQLKNVLGTPLYIKSNIEEKIGDVILNQIDNGEYDNQAGSDFYLKYLRKYYNYFNGLIYNSTDDGKSIVSYNKDNIVPLRYTLDEGQTWFPFMEWKGYRRAETTTTEKPINTKNPKPKEVADLIIKDPSLIPELDITVLGKEDIIAIIIARPHLIDKFDITEFDSYDITTILCKRPELISKFDISKIKTNGVFDIIISQPKTIKHFDLKKYDFHQRHLEQIKTYQPELLKYFKYLEK